MTKRTLITWIVLGSLGVVVTLIVLYGYQIVYMRLYENEESVQRKTAIRNLQLEYKLRKLEFNFYVERYVTIGGLITIPVVLLLVISIVGYRQVKQAKGLLLDKEAAFRQSSIFTMQLGQFRSLPVRWQDIQYMAPIIPQVLSVEALASYDTERAFELAERITTHSRQMLSVLKTPILPLQDPTHVQEELPEHAGVSADFSSILAMMVPQGELFFGVLQESRTYLRGTLDDLLSTMVLGESGSGKTSWLRALMVQLLLTFQTSFLIFDPHRKNKESLAKTAYPLTTLQNVDIVTAASDVRDACQKGYQELERRLNQEDAEEPPYVIVIDELSCWMKGKYKNSLAFLMEKIAGEGRKVNMYLLCSSTSSLTTRTGNDSAVRDALVSSFVFRCKKNVARYLLQDGEDAKQVSQIREKGVALFTPASKDSRMVEVLYAKACDMHIAYHRYTTLYGTESPLISSDMEKTSVAPPLELSLVKLNELCDQRMPQFSSKNKWQQALAETSGVSYPLIKNIMSGHATVTAERASELVSSAKKL
jgi:hypothetical protein